MTEIHVFISFALVAAVWSAVDLLTGTTRPGGGRGLVMAVALVGWLAVAVFMGWSMGRP